LDPARTSPYQFRQFWVNTDDAMVGVYLKMLSLRPLDEIESLLVEHTEAPERRIAQRALATEMTTLVHGADAAETVEHAAAVLFGGDPTDAGPEVFELLAAEVPTVDLPDQLEGHLVHDVLIAAGVAKSTSEVRRLLAQGAIRAGNRVLDADGVLQASDLLSERYLLLRKGKRDFVVGKVSRAG
jgi:tyrosyl-tRNA synthetase